MLPYLVGVHGVRNYSYFRRTGSAAEAAASAGRDWTCWLGGTPVTVGYYAHHLRRGAHQGADDVDTLDDFAAGLLIDWVDRLRPAPQTAQGDRTARARAAADWLTRRYGRTVRAFATAFVREVGVYLKSPGGKRRLAARDAVGSAIAAGSGHERVVVVAHSLGSVVTYEALWAAPELRVDLLVTLGSPLGMPGVVFDRLDPLPDGRGARPPGVRRWVNLADVGDLVAVPRTGLGGSFDGVDTEVTDLRIAGWDFHTAQSYLRCADVTRHLGL
ncbi:hypothetical protein [Nonomuraea cavernae]|uniref:hypothetical protein n=1 Tax=Nonomuraea cavernae TaxID=2045107 RepID=UPI0033ED3FDC